MPAIRLTEAKIERTKPPEKGERVELRDTQVPGLGLRIGGRRRVWFVVVFLQRPEGPQRIKLTLGEYPAVSVEKARELAVDARRLAEEGENPAQLQQAKKAAKTEAQRNTFASVRNEFLDKYRGRQQRRPAPRTLAELKRVLESDLFAAWEERALAKITRRDVLDVLDVLTKRGAEVMANRALAYLHLLFGWAVDRGIIETDPAERVKKPGAERSRERVLSVEELRAIWHGTAPEPGELFGPIVRLLLLTGQRRAEVAGMRWSELTDGFVLPANGEQSGEPATCPAWILPADRTKNRREQIVPLSEPVQAILATRKAEQAPLVEVAAHAAREAGLDAAPDFVFTSHWLTPFSGWSKCKARLDARIGIASWTLHDLRRTLATRMAEDLHIPPHIVEAVLNHVSGSRAGVAGTYNRSLYLRERRAALDAWAGYVLRIVGEVEAGNVVELLRMARAV
jgi:integrase